MENSKQFPIWIKRTKPKSKKKMKIGKHEHLHLKNTKRTKENNTKCSLFRI